jgi:hypothetical protein
MKIIPNKMKINANFNFLPNAGINYTKIKLLKKCFFFVILLAKGGFAIPFCCLR